MKIRLQREHASASIQASVDALEIAPTFADIPSLVLNPDHCLSDLMLKKARYKVYWGGRGSAKSWSIAEALIRKAAGGPVRILCCREHQNSIKDSSHKLLKDTITRLGMDSWFNVTANSITSRAGAEFIFKGLFNNEEGIKSTEGIDICWVEEAQTVSARSWQTMPATIRKDEANEGDGAEIWVSYNLISEDDATHKRFVNPDGTAKRSNSIVHKINYDSNPYFSKVLREEMEDDKSTDYHLYEHIWLGMPLKVSKAIIFSDKYEVKEFADDLWRQADRRRIGLDFGFAQDPLACISFFIIQDGKHQDLYIERECYDTGIELDEMKTRIVTNVPEAAEWPIKADNSRPETISHLNRSGVSCSGAEKWEGCVKDGIAHIRKFRRIYIHPRCTKTATEARLYSYKVDKNQVDDKGQPQVLPIIVDKHNHAWDAIRYGMDGEIQRSGTHEQWKRLAEQN